MLFPQRGLVSQKDTKDSTFTELQNIIVIVYMHFNQK